MKKLLQFGWVTVLAGTGSLAMGQWYPYYPPAPPPMYFPPPGYQYRQVPRQEDRQEGPDIRRAQEQLQKLGYHRGSVDGVAGPNTRSALARFQADHGLTPDGVLGPATRRALDRRTGSESGDRQLSVKPERPRSEKPESTPRVRASNINRSAEQVSRGSAGTEAPGVQEQQSAASDRAAERDNPEPQSSDERETENNREPVSSGITSARVVPSQATVTTDNRTSAGVPATAVPAAARTAATDAQPVPLDNVPAKTRRY